MINATIILVAMIRTLRAAIPMKRMMIASAITSRKRVTRQSTMTSAFCRAQATHPENGVALAQDLHCALIPVAQAAGATTITMWLRMTAS
jgi:hypothetical protein